MRVQTFTLDFRRAYIRERVYVNSPGYGTKGEPAAVRTVADERARRVAGTVDSRFGFSPSALRVMWLPYTKRKSKISAARAQGRVGEPEKRRGVSKRANAAP